MRKMSELITQTISTDLVKRFDFSRLPMFLSDDLQSEFIPDVRHDLEASAANIVGRSSGLLIKRNNSAQIKEKDTVLIKITEVTDRTCTKVETAIVFEARYYDDLSLNLIKVSTDISME